MPGDERDRKVLDKPWASITPFSLISIPCCFLCVAFLYFIKIIDMTAIMWTKIIILAIETFRFTEIKIELHIFVQKAMRANVQDYRKIFAFNLRLIK